MILWKCSNFLIKKGKQIKDTHLNNLKAHSSFHCNQLLTTRLWYGASSRWQIGLEVVKWRSGLATSCMQTTVNKNYSPATLSSIQHVICKNKYLWDSSCTADACDGEGETVWLLTAPQSNKDVSQHFSKKEKKKKNDTRSFWTATRTKKVGFAPWRTFRLQGQVIGHTFCGYLSIHSTAIMHLHVLLFSHYVLSDSLWPYILRHSRLPWLHVLDAAYSNFLFPISWKGTVISSVLELRKFVWQDYFLWMSFP